MDAAELRARIEAGLTFRHRVGGATFTCVLPTRFRVEQLHAEAYAAADGHVVAALPHYRMALVCGAVRGWEGLVVADLWPDGEDATPLAFDPTMAALLFEERADLLQALFEELQARVSARKKLLEADAGNSPAGSPGSAGDPAPGPCGEPDSER